MPRRFRKTAELPALVGLKEACEMLGVPRMTLYRWMKPGSGNHGPDQTYMVPAKRVAAGPVWVRADIERFAREVGRRAKQS